PPLGSVAAGRRRGFGAADRPGLPGRCPREGAPMTRRDLTLRHFVPLAGFVLPTVLIGYGVVIPRSCIAGWNQLTVGFGATVAGACLASGTGVSPAPRSRGKSEGQAWADRPPVASADRVARRDRGPDHGRRDGGGEPGRLAAPGSAGGRRDPR